MPISVFEGLQSISQWLFEGKIQFSYKQKGYNLPKCIWYLKNRCFNKNIISYKGNDSEEFSANIVTFYLYIIF